MARTTLTVTPITNLGVRIHSGFDVAADAVNGNDFDNDGATFLFVRNSDVSSRNIVFKGPLTVDGAVVPDKTIAVTAGAILWFGPFAPRIYNQTPGNVAGRVSFDVSSALLFVQAIRIPPVQ